MATITAAYRTFSTDGREVKVLGAADGYDCDAVYEVTFLDDPSGRIRHMLLNSVDYRPQPLGDPNICPATDEPHRFEHITGERGVGIPDHWRCEECGAAPDWWR
jgi:hypothetical protein